MSFFHNLNKRLADLSAKQDAEQITENAKATAPKSRLAQALNERDLGKHNNATTGFAALAKKAGGGNIEKGNRIAGAQLAKMRAKGQVEESDMEEGLGNALKNIGGNIKQGYLDNRAKAAEKAYYNQDFSSDEYAEKRGAAKQKADMYRAQRQAVAGQPAVTDSQVEESDMEEGNAFTGALVKTPKGGKFKVGNKEFTDTSSIEEGFKEMDAWLASREKEKGTGKFDRKERTLPGGMKATTYTRKHEDEPSDDEEVTTITIKKKGRPKGKDKGPERVTKGAWKHKGERKEKTKEDLDSDGVMMTRPTNCSSESIEHGEQAEYNDEAGMAKDSLHTIVRHARELEKALRSNENLPEWVQEKIGQIKGMMSSVTDYIISTHERDVEQATGREGITTVIPEKAPPGAKAERMVKGIKKSLSKDGKLSDKDKAIAYATTWKAHKQGKVEEESTAEKDDKAERAAKKVAKDIEYDEGHKGKDDNKAERAGKKVAKDIEYDDKKDKEEKVDETTVAGSVAPVTNAAPKAGKGMQFGKGVYEGFNNSVESMITETMNVSVNMNAGEDGQTRKSITVSAEGKEADQLAALLKMAGLHGQSSESCGCGNTPCSCDETVEEAYGDTDETLNNPDWPTDKETLEAEPNLRTYSGGLNGPKSTGQTTVPVVASQLRRQASMEESVELERSLFKTWKNYKG
jgi:hypothetical protein